MKFPYKSVFSVCIIYPQSGKCYLSKYDPYEKSCLPYFKVLLVTVQSAIFLYQNII